MQEFDRYYGVGVGCTDGSLQLWWLSVAYLFCVLALLKADVLIHMFYDIKILSKDLLIVIAVIINLVLKQMHRFSDLSIYKNMLPRPESIGTNRLDMLEQVLLSGYFELIDRDYMRAKALPFPVNTEAIPSSVVHWSTVGWRHFYLKY